MSYRQNTPMTPQPPWTTDGEKTPENAVFSVPPAEHGNTPHQLKPEPTRYGDWEKNGRCIDF
ncbi:MAG: DUF1674 domain-containing protein [Methylococcaceae bacterium]|nr:MAG: DUF1674 domain-containing protein [Methylococcaceae bacterium]